MGHSARTAAALLKALPPMKLVECLGRAQLVGHFRRLVAHLQLLVHQFWSCWGHQSYVEKKDFQDILNLSQVFIKPPCGSKWVQFIAGSKLSKPFSGNPVKPKLKHIHIWRNQRQNETITNTLTNRHLTSMGSMSNTPQQMLRESFILQWTAVGSFRVKLCVGASLSPWISEWIVIWLVHLVTYFKELSLEGRSKWLCLKQLSSLITQVLTSHEYVHIGHSVLYVQCKG